MADLTLVQLAQAITDKEDVQTISLEGWYSGHTGKYLMNTFFENPSEVRIKPKLKPVDLSVLVDSGILCEMWNSDGQSLPKSVAFLKYAGINSDYPYQVQSGGFWRYCRPALLYWQCASNLEKPLADFISAGFLYVFNPSDTAFRITGLREGFCWPWECK